MRLGQGGLCRPGSVSIDEGLSMVRVVIGFCAVLLAASCATTGGLDVYNNAAVLAQPADRALG